MWGYLSEFWNAITQQVVEAGVYTIDWFQSLGNAVAGAIGGLFSDLIHHIYDFFYVIYWLTDNLKNLFSILLKPLSWIFNFGKGFFYTAFKTPAELGLEIGEVGSFGSNVFEVFNAVPYVNYIFAGAGAVLGLVFLIFIVKKLSTI